VAVGDLEVSNSDNLGLFLAKPLKTHTNRVEPIA